MEFSEFEKGFMLLRGAYGEKIFPKERESVLWNRYKGASTGDFKKAVDKILTRMPAAHTLVEWLDENLEPKESRVYRSAFECDPCRDFGFGFDGNTVVACYSCARGRQISPQELAYQQANYNRGMRLIKNPREKVLQELPYDPNERYGA